VQPLNPRGHGALSSRRDVARVGVSRSDVRRVPRRLGSRPRGRASHFRHAGQLVCRVTRSSERYVATSAYKCSESSTCADRPGFALLLRGALNGAFIGYPFTTLTRKRGYLIRASRAGRPTAHTHTTRPDCGG